MCGNTVVNNNKTFRKIIEIKNKKNVQQYYID